MGIKNTNPFKNERDFEQRCQETSSIKLKHPYKCPVVVQRSYKEEQIEEIDRNKFLVPNDMTIHGLLYILRKRLKLQNESQALYLFTEKGVLFTTNILVSQIYDTQKDDDGYLYLFYNSENTFG